MPSFSTLLTLSLYVMAAGLALCTLLGFLGRQWWRFELLSHFRLQYAVLAALCAMGLLLLGETAAFFLTMGVALFNTALIAPFYRRPDPSDPPSATYRILSANILGHNRQYAQISQMLQEANPDLALLVEYDPHHHQNLQDVTQTFPHTHFLPRNDNYGLALLSRLPLDSCEFVFLNDERKPALLAKLTLDGRPLTVIGVHTTPPKSAEMTRMRDRQMGALAQLAAKQDGEVILLGDFNATSWSYSFSDLLQHSQLLDSRRGFGVQPTWPAELPPMRIPIDHLLHTHGVRILKRRTGPFSGSDHRPLIVDFSLDAAGQSS